MGFYNNTHRVLTNHESEVSATANVVLLFQAWGHQNDHGNELLISTLNVGEMSIERKMVAQESIAPATNTKQSYDFLNKKIHNDSALRRQCPT